MLLSEILERLAQPVPRELIKQKKTFEKGKSSGLVDFIPWVNLCDLLDQRCGIGAWSWEIKTFSQVQGAPPIPEDPEEVTERTEWGEKKPKKKPKQRDYLVLVGSLTIYGDDRQLTREATGTEEIECSSYGDPSSNAEAMALRRACSKFGLGRDLWRKEVTEGRRQTWGGEPQLPPVPRNQPAPPPGQLTREEWLALKAKKEQAAKN